MHQLQARMDMDGRYQYQYRKHRMQKTICGIKRIHFSIISFVSEKHLLKEVEVTYLMSA